jgi:2-polyprenyl-3-methyl-5-hydroxy-6-metoxy-1,4-benzoquinol methylase
MTSITRNERFWDRLAQKYARNPVGDMPAYEKTLERTGSWLSERDRVLEFGCGTGSTALRLAPTVAHVTATDISGEMIAIAKKKAIDAGLGNIDFRKATLDDIDPAGDGYDAVLGFNVLHMFDDVQAELARIRNLLKPDGLFISKTPCVGDMNMLVRVVVPVMQFFGKAPSVNFFTAAELGRDIRAAGFEIVEQGLHGTKGKDVRPFIVAKKV